ncbi:hypothetical protein TREPR_0076 [Treponema primitia ZAS-2]|uniref:Uncharacterized protein n=1 Tax=Treponema primitia (strain ATCC BAA-887 / DSM 12427 / ZAS-2) TaxID=545694 RepID=F5YNB7_TREPZ|nr:hypothetical protein TREPR_0076 [Treponema primitia ZAS-2]
MIFFMPTVIPCFIIGLQGNILIGGIRFYILPLILPINYHKEHQNYGLF